MALMQWSDQVQLDAVLLYRTNGVPLKPLIYHVRKWELLLL